MKLVYLIPLLSILLSISCGKQNKTRGNYPIPPMTDHKNKVPPAAVTENKEVQETIPYLKIEGATKVQINLTSLTNPEKSIQLGFKNKVKNGVQILTNKNQRDNFHWLQLLTIKGIIPQYDYDKQVAQEENQLYQISNWKNQNYYNELEKMKGLEYSSYDQTGNIQISFEISPKNTSQIESLSKIYIEASYIDTITKKHTSFATFKLLDKAHSSVILKTSDFNTKKRLYHTNLSEISQRDILYIIKHRRNIFLKVKTFEYLRGQEVHQFVEKIEELKNKRSRVILSFNDTLKYYYSSNDMQDVQAFFKDYNISTELFHNGDIKKLIYKEKDALSHTISSIDELLSDYAEEEKNGNWTSLPEEINMKKNIKRGKTLILSYASKEQILEVNRTESIVLERSRVEREIIISDLKPKDRLKIEITGITYTPVISGEHVGKDLSTVQRTNCKFSYNSNSSRVHHRTMEETKDNIYLSDCRLEANRQQCEFYFTRLSYKESPRLFENTMENLNLKILKNGKAYPLNTVFTKKNQISVVNNKSKIVLNLALNKEFLEKDSEIKLVILQYKQSKTVTWGRGRDKFCPVRGTGVNFKFITPNENNTPHTAKLPIRPIYDFIISKSSAGIN